MWSIFFVLPNISLSEPVGNASIAIAPHGDSRVREHMRKSPFAESLVEHFEDQFRTQAHPSVLVINDNAPHSVKEIEAIAGFRNAFALSTIIQGHEYSLKGANVAFPLYSDYFDFYPIGITKNDDGFIATSPSLTALDRRYQEFRGQTSPGLARLRSLSAKPDDHLFKLIERVWQRRFARAGRNEWSARALFRSLEMAYQATTMPYKNHSTIYDYGSSASLWVSAFEILSHPPPPRQGRANLSSVLDLLGSYQWNDKVIKKKAYKLRCRGRNPRVNLVQKLYEELYETRNDFLHGNAVRPNRLHPFKNRNVPPITSFGPLIYKVALLSFLNQFENKTSKKRIHLNEYCTKLVIEWGLRDAILKSRG